MLNCHAFAVCRGQKTKPPALKLHTTGALLPAVQQVVLHHSCKKVCTQHSCSHGDSACSTGWRTSSKVTTPVREALHHIAALQLIAGLLRSHSADCPTVNMQSLQKVPGSDSCWAVLAALSPASGFEACLTPNMCSRWRPEEHHAQQLDIVGCLCLRFSFGRSGPQHPDASQTDAVAMLWSAKKPVLAWQGGTPR